MKNQRGILIAKNSQTCFLGMIVLVLFIFGLSGCSGKQEAQTKPESPVKANSRDYDERSQEFFERKAGYDLWMQSAERVAQYSGDPEAKKLLEFLKEETTIATPQFANGKPSISIIHFGRTVEELEEAVSKPLIVVPLLVKDDALSTYWQDHNEKQGGSFIMETNTIILSGKVASTPVWKGFIILHEGSHAMRFKQGNLVLNASKELVCQEELYTWTFMLRLVGIIGGSEYRAALEEEMKYIGDNSKLPGVLAPVRAYNPRLDVAFGESLSGNEQTVRDTFFHRHAVLAYLEKNFPDKLNSMKREVLCPLIASKSKAS